jgi:regulation of enolase protein 1 (concanavalin A-like superfamily)
MRRVPWSEGSWTHPPASVIEDGDDLVVTAVAGSDAWRVTSYGFVHDDEHALLAPFPTEGALEVAFTADLTQQFDQAGLFFRVSAEHWIKAGVEFADGVAQLGVVVTEGFSDWSAAPVPEWAGERVTIRASRSGDAVTVRARIGDDAWRFVRLVPLDPALEVHAGPFTCAPSRAGLAVRFHSWGVGEPDGSLH